MGIWNAACSQYSHSSSHTLVPHDVLELPGASRVAGAANGCIGPAGKQSRHAPQTLSMVGREPAAVVPAA